jgi:hypothetical protein
MESIISQIFGSVSTKFIQELVKKHIIDDDKVDAAKAVWKTCVSGATVNVEFENGEAATFEPTEEKVAKEKKSEPEKKEECGKCVYVPTRGKTPGTACGKKAMVGKKMCSSHKKHEGDTVASDYETRSEPVVAEEKVVEEKVAEEKKKTVTEKRTCVWTITKGKASGGKVCGATVKGATDFCTRHAKNANKVQEKVEEPVQEKEKPIVVSLDKKTGRWTHKDSGFVMKSKEERVVNGKTVNGVVTDISEDDIEMLKTLKFKYELPIKTVMRKSDVEEIVKEMLEDEILGEELEEEPEEVAGDDIEGEEELEEEEMLEDDE